MHREIRMPLCIYYWLNNRQYVGERCLLEGHDNDSMATLKRLNSMQWGAISVPNTLTSPPHCKFNEIAHGPAKHIAHRYDLLVKASGVINDKQAGPNHYLM